MIKQEFKKSDLFELIDNLILYESLHGIHFDNNGFPVFEDWMFYRGDIKYINPFRHRNDTPNKKETLVCFYETDASLYPKLNRKRMKDTAIELLNYAGFVGFDLSIFKDFLYPMQELYILVNLVIDMYFILQGNKMIPNLRADETGGRSYFYLFNTAPIVCCGTLGCAKRKDTRVINANLISNYAHQHKEQLVIQYGPNLVNEENVISIKPYGRKEKKDGQR